MGALLISSVILSALLEPGCHLTDQGDLSEDNYKPGMKLEQGQGGGRGKEWLNLWPLESLPTFPGHRCET